MPTKFLAGGGEGRLWTRFALEKACSERGSEIVRLEHYEGGINVLADQSLRASAALSPALAAFHRTNRRKGPVLGDRAKSLARHI